MAWELLFGPDGTMTPMLAGSLLLAGALLMVVGRVAGDDGDGSGGQQRAAVSPPQTVLGFVSRFGFSNVIWVLFLGSSFVPWKFLGLSREDGSPQRFGHLWNTSQFVLGRCRPPPVVCLPRVSLLQCQVEPAAARLGC
jgi:hypothetical protein